MAPWTNQPTTWQQFSEFLSLADSQHTLANCTSGIFLLQLAKCLKTDGEGNSEPVEHSVSSQEASISYRRWICRVNHKAPAFVWLEEDRCKVVLFISFESIWGVIMIKTSKSPEMPANVTSSLSVIKVPVLSFTGLPHTVWCYTNMAANHNCFSIIIVQMYKQLQV